MDLFGYKCRSFAQKNQTGRALAAKRNGAGGGAWGRGLLCEKKRVLGEFGAVFWWVLMKLLEINVSVLAVL